MLHFIPLTPKYIINFYISTTKNKKKKPQILHLVFSFLALIHDCVNQEIDFNAIMSKSYMDFREAPLDFH